jgi:ribosomal protein L40E
MAFTEDMGNVGKKFTQFGQSAVQKAKNLTDTAKLSAGIAEEEKRIKNYLMQIGRVFYENLPENPGKEYEEWLTKISTSKAVIAASKEQLCLNKGMLICEKCGAEISNTAKFCSYCGTPVPITADREFDIDIIDV